MAKPKGQPCGSELIIRVFKAITLANGLLGTKTNGDFVVRQSR